jgi:serine/threonine protein kinase
MLELVGCGGGTQIKREISTMKMVKHPNIVQLLEVNSQQLLSLSLPGVSLTFMPNCSWFFVSFFEWCSKV